MPVHLRRYKSIFADNVEPDEVGAGPSGHGHTADNYRIPQS
jgi:hypothetical protein